MTTLVGGLAGSAADADGLYSVFSSWVDEQGITLYPAQDEAILELVTGTNVVLATPTGSGKSLVAVAAHYFAMATGIRSVYTAPIKALVSE
jgi:superfamily II RNA helicase